MTPADDVPSPCTGVCRIGADTVLCEGCARTIEEIVEWSSATSEEKRFILRQFAQRKSCGSSATAGNYPQ
ncbi:DUF1289 domain-containing protein [Sphingomonas sp. ID0503]|uniref:DUF1289 domain-containing protein n=1 Tax=Sphingomonas sp. ID0503 TaxID=3399691 RepID=UPI003AFA22C8